MSEELEHDELESEDSDDEVAAEPEKKPADGFHKLTDEVKLDELTLPCDVFTTDPDQMNRFLDSLLGRPTAFDTVCNTVQTYYNPYTGKHILMRPRRYRNVEGPDYLVIHLAAHVPAVKG